MDEKLRNCQSPYSLRRRKGLEKWLSTQPKHQWKGRGIKDEEEEDENEEVEDDGGGGGEDDEVEEEVKEKVEGKG